jgi:hypothetical protein
VALDNLRGEVLDAQRRVKRRHKVPVRVLLAGFVF